MTKDAATKGLDWPGLMRVGITGLKLRPAEFWELTPVELKLLLGGDVGPATMDRARLQDLMADFPDPPQTAVERDMSIPTS